MGAGSMGSAIGGFLAKSGHDVTLVGRKAHMDAVRERGLRITGIWGEHLVTDLKVRTDVNGLRSGDFDLVIVAVKSYDTSAAAKAVAPLLDNATLVCSYQNGLGNAERIAEVIGWPRTFGARVIYGVRIPEPGCAEITVIAQPTALGVYHPETPVDRVKAIAAAMNEAGSPTIFTEKIATLLWGKVAYNCALNPLSALLNVPYGVLSETEHTLSIMREIVAEFYAVGNAMSIPLEPATVDEYMDLLVNVLIPPTAAHYPSMHADFLHKRRTEIDALNGIICCYGDEHGVPCPTNYMLTRLVRAREYSLGVRY